LILSEISKSDGTICQILRPNALNSISAGALPQTPLEELTALHTDPQLDLMGPTSKGREGRGRGGKRKEKGKGGRGGEEEGRRGRRGEGICRTNVKLLARRLLSTEFSVRV